MKLMMRMHRYLSCFVAPAMLFFAISGAWQAFRLHEDRKDGSYQAPAAVAALSQVHKAERLHGSAAVWFKASQVAVAGAFTLTAILGVVMALRLARPTWIVWACLAAGVALPALLAVLARAG